jgi:hypothetical protein
MKYTFYLGCADPAPIENKADDVKDSFCEELKHAFNKVPKHHIEILVGDFSAKVGREEI